MLSAYKKLYDILDSRERYLTLVVFAFMTLVAIAETAGVASIMPFIGILSKPELVETNIYLSTIYSFFEFTSLNSFYIFSGFIVFSLLVLSLVLKGISTWIQFRFAHLRNHSVAMRLIDKYLHEPYYWFLNQNTSVLSTRILNEVSQVVHEALFPAMQIIAQGLVASFIIILLIVIDPLLSLITAVVLLIAYLSVYYFNRNILMRLGESTILANQERFRVVQEGFGGIKDVKIAGIEAAFVERFRSPSLIFAKNSLKQKILMELPSYIMQGFVYGGMMLIIIYLLSTKGDLGDALPVIAVYALAAYRLMPSLQALYQYVSKLRYSTPSLNALHNDFSRHLNNQSNSAEKRENVSFATSPIKLPKYSINLESISYSYPNARELALDNINISIPINYTIGLVGTSGSGKTTLVDIILGLLTPTKGHLFADNTKICFENIRSWQDIIGYVPQQIYLTDDSVVANIAFGVPADKIDIAAVEKAAKLANLHDFIMSDLPDGYRATVGEKGTRLSGGQRQRIGIARALYRDPAILILDEATSALDNITERAVMEAVSNLGHKKTIIIIAHRLSTVEKCDKLFLMEKGKVIAQGDYNSLIKNNTKFREMAGHG